jgi:hypothetical protein
LLSPCCIVSTFTVLTLASQTRVHTRVDLSPPRHSLCVPLLVSLLVRLCTPATCPADPTSLALFLGTGNATPDLPTAMMERLYTSPTYGMWYPVDPKSLSSNLPPMVVFPESTDFYTKWQKSLEERNVKVSWVGSFVCSVHLIRVSLWCSLAGRTSKRRLSSSLLATLSRP